MDEQWLSEATGENHRRKKAPSFVKRVVFNSCFYAVQIVNVLFFKLPIVVAAERVMNKVWWSYLHAIDCASDLPLGALPFPPSESYISHTGRPQVPLNETDDSI